MRFAKMVQATQSGKLRPLRNLGPSLSRVREISVTKSYTGSQVIAIVAMHGWRVGRFVGARVVRPPAAWRELA